MLDDKTIQKLQPSSKPKKYADGGGLFLFIPVTGKKLWRLAYRFDRKAKLLTFGEYPQVSLLVARQKRDEAKKLLKEGIDPSEQKKAQIKICDTDTFRHVALEWYEQQTLHCDKKYRSFLLSNMEKYFFPAFGDKPISDILANDILMSIDPLQKSGKMRNGRRLTDFCGQIFRYAVQTKKIEYDITRDLPPALRSKMPVHRASTLDDEKLGQILLNLEQHSGYFPVGCALRLVPLLFVRSGELRCAKWKEFDFTCKLWIIPAERTIGKTEHTVPLSRQAVKILKELKKYSGQSDFLFPSVHSHAKPIDMSTITVSLRRRGYDDVKLSFDGIRSLVAKILADRGYKKELIALQLARQNTNKKSEKLDCWQYLKERKVMMQEWSDYLSQARNKALDEKSERNNLC